MKKKIIGILICLLFFGVSILFIPDIFVKTVKAPSSDGLVSYWRFDEGSGTTASDSVNGNHGAIYGAMWTTGKVRNALYFDGIDDYVEIPHSESLNITHDSAVEAWIYLDSGSISGVSPVLTKGSASCFNMIGYRYNLFEARLFKGALSCWLDYDSWHHLVVTKEDSTQFLYLNGELEDSYAATPGELWETNSEPLLIGCNDEYYLIGLIDELAVYSRALSFEEIQQHYTDGLAGFGYFEFENTDPVANAGENQIVSMGDIVTLDGSGSYDLQDSIGDLDFYWEYTGLKWYMIYTPSIDDENNVIAHFNAPTLVERELKHPSWFTAGSYTFQLTVTDSYGLSDTDDVCITIIEDLDHAVFVSSKLGDNSNSGSPDEPVKTINKAFEKAMQTYPYSDIYLDRGNYSSRSTLTLFDNMSLIGGFVAYEDEYGNIVGWNKTVTGEPTNISGGATALKVLDIENVTIIQDLSINSSDGGFTGGPGQNSIAISIFNAGNELRIFDNVIHAGEGGPGANGENGVKGADGVNGGHGKVGYSVKDSKYHYNSGGFAGYDGIRPQGAVGGTAEAYERGWNDGMSGHDASDYAPGGGDGGNGGTDSPHIHGRHGEDGANGFGGSSGNGGDGKGSIIDHKWVGSRGQDGNDGGCGLGGGGGGGAGASQISEDGYTKYIGGSGGGGGGAASGGTGGKGGYCGGASIGIFMSHASPYIELNRISTEGGGRGGDGGTPGCGGAGGIGGFGGVGYQVCIPPFGCEWLSGSGAYGGNGGAGGPGGCGGGGGGGISECLKAVENSYPITVDNIKSNGLPGEGGKGGTPDPNSACPGGSPGGDGEPGAYDDPEVKYDIPPLDITPDVYYDGMVGPPIFNAESMYVPMRWNGSDVVLTLFSPSGREINRNTIAPDVFHKNGSTFEYYYIINPEPGQWMYQIYGADVPPEGEVVDIEVIVKEANNPPVALCKDVVVPADSNCMALASIDNGSYDPDSDDPISITQIPPGPYPLGETLVSLTIDDGRGSSDTCQATVTVVDETPPLIHFSYPVVRVIQETDEGSEVTLSAEVSDICDPNPTVAWSQGPTAVFPLGETVVTVTATDASGNGNSLDVTVIVYAAPIYNMNKGLYYDNIQASINDAEINDTIIVLPGFYYENIIVDKPITLLGANSDTTSIHGNDSWYVVKVIADGVNISGFTIRNSSYGLPGIHLSSSSNNTITNCKCYNTYQGILLTSSSNNKISNCKIYNNSHGISISLSSNNNTITNCIAYNNHNGIGIGDSCINNTITNFIAYNNTNVGIQLWNASNNKITNCTTYNNTEFGIQIRTFSNNNIVTNCTTYNNTQAGISISSQATNNTITHCTTHRNGRYGFLLIGAAKHNIISNCLAHNNTRQGIRLNSESNNNIITDCTVNNNNWGIYLRDDCKNNVIKNCTIYNHPYYNINIEYSSNYNTVNNCTVYNGEYGIYTTYSSDSLVKNCKVYNCIVSIATPGSLNNTIENCIAYNNRDGINLGKNSNGTITNCTVYNNTLFGIQLFNSSNSSITNCTAYNNSIGIKVISDSNNNTITNCTAYDNTNGIYLWGSSNNIIVNCKLHNNSYSGVSLINSYFNDIFDNFIISNYYGAYLIHSNRSQVINNTFEHNYKAIEDPNSNYNIFQGNLIQYNEYGITITDSQYNIYKNNQFSENTYGIIINENSVNNHIYYNNFIDNTIQAQDTGSNTWDDGAGTGNFWDDYTGEDTDGDGIGDTSYHSLDQYPIMEMYSNTPPVADANGPYVSSPGDAVTFDASDSYDENAGDILKYRWDFDNDGDWDTDWSFDSTSTFSWDVEYSGDVVVEVTDSEYIDTDSTTITVRTILATIDFNPDTLNLLSAGQPVTVYIELPEGFDVNQININTILLNSVVPAESTPWEIGDEDEDMVLDLMVKFNRSDVQAILKVGEEESIVIIGLLNDGSGFGGEDRIRVIKE